MDKIGEKKKETVAIYAKKLPAEIVGRFQQNLSVGDCLKTESVSPFWKRALKKWGWTEQQKLNADIIFEEASEEEIEQFWEKLEDGSCQLASLIHCGGPWLRELDLLSFGWENTWRFLPQIIKSFKSLRKLEKLDIRGFRLQDFVVHLPPTLRELKTSNQLDINTLQALSNRCPNLEDVPFQYLENKNDVETEAVIELIGKFPRQNKLDLRYFWLRSEKQGALASFGQLKALEQLDIYHCVSLDGESLGAIVEECQQLRSLLFDTRKLTEGELFQLAKLPNLTVLELFDRKGEFSDAILKAIAHRGQLKKLVIYGSKSNESLTDASVVYLVDRCKSLISLDLWNYPQITERSLEAVVAEVRRRHGSPPRSLPSDAQDPEIFYFRFYNTGIPWDSEQMVDENPWLRFGYDSREIV